MEKTTKYRNCTKVGDLICGERSLGDGWIRFEGNLDLLRIDAALDHSEDAFNRIWDMQDGYGEPGYTPTQGYDWSGIRDSTVATRDQMDAVAREYVTDADLAETFGLPLEAFRG
jgi:hypothetical protein